jgi:ferrous iron transport protein B
MLPSVMSHASAAAFLVVMMLFVPCVATIAVLKQEMNSSKWFYSTIVMTLIVSYLGGMMAYQLFKLLAI